MTHSTVEERVYTVRCPTCRMLYGIADHYREHLRTQWNEYGRHDAWYCPAGHAITFVGESELTKVRRERDRLAQENARAWEAVNERTKEARAAKAELKRAHKRTAAGVCPCCNRSFVALARHIKTKHPDFRPKLEAVS